MPAKLSDNLKTQIAAQSIFDTEYIRFDERGHKNIKPKPFWRPAFEMAIKKIFKKKEKETEK